MVGVINTCGIESLEKWILENIRLIDYDLLGLN